MTRGLIKFRQAILIPILLHVLLELFRAAHVPNTNIPTGGFPYSAVGFSK